jgi:peptidoglycan-associated lipoprotein
MKKVFLILTLFVGLLFGCGKKQVPPIANNFPISKKESPQPSFNASEEEQVQPQTTVPSLGEEETTPVSTTSEKEKIKYYKLYGRSTPPLLAVFFDFDSFRIRDDMWDRIKKNVMYLLNHPSLKVQLQGNCDERGTNEYNMALGAKRALEVKKVLIKLGVSPERISTISFGEERPLCKESTEECWAINRRVDFVIIK